MPPATLRSRAIWVGLAAALASFHVGCSVDKVGTVAPATDDAANNGVVPDGAAIDAPSASDDGNVPDAACAGSGPTVKKVAGAACTCGNECSTGACVLGVCCSGTSCIKRPLGAACEAAGDCQSSFCADGVCCNLACTGACVSCNRPTKMGECGPNAIGTPDLHKACRTDPASTCGQSGLCNGQGGCSKHTSGTVCEVPVCSDGQTKVPARICDGAGTCLDAKPVDCAPFTCDTGACRESCTDSTQCSGGNACNNGSCGLRGNGQNCTAGGQCQSGFCVDGVCCDNDCTGRCAYCAFSSNLGTCTTVAQGLPDPRAAAGVTDPALICVDQGPSSCGTNGLCDGGRDCQKYPDGTICGLGKCDAAANLETASSLCLAGSCSAGGTRTCAPYLGCSGNNCSTFCFNDGQCTGGNFCTANSCGTRAIGSLCSKDSDCAAPGICAQGRCCATACNAKCMACNIDGSLGSCRAVPVGGTDPTGTCKQDACNSNCDGMGGCRLEAAGTICAASTCGSSSSLTTWTCSGGGACQMSTSSCPSTEVCMTDRCAPPAKQPAGGDCVDNADCLSDACVGGKCCNSACSGACKACTVATNWTCSNKPDDTACGGGMICTAGICTKKVAGKDCTDGIECQSGSCLGGKCCADSCTGACKECTSGNNWLCSNRVDGTACGGAFVCTAGSCGPPPKKSDGASCGAGSECQSNNCVGGFCCAGPCSGACQQCTAGTGWACMNVPDGTVCGSGVVCMSGSCGSMPKKDNGQACGADAECKSSACAGGFCCASACSGACMECTAGTNWMCGNKTDGTSCGTGLICQSGSCAPPPKKGPGAMCTANSDCVSNACVGGFCCASQCSSSCQECTGASGWTCRNKTDGASCGTDMVCNGGACKGGAGATCVANGDCVSRSCLAGKCCADSCTGTCKQCPSSNAWLCMQAPNDTPCGNGKVCKGGVCK